MRAEIAWRPKLDLSPSGLAGLAVALYFFGVGAGVLAGSTPSVLLQGLMTEMPADVTGGAVQIALAILLVVGPKPKLTSLMLAALVFWSSYVGNVLNHGSAGLGLFWRDLAMLFALLYCYGGAFARFAAAPRRAVQPAKSLRSEVQIQDQSRHRQTRRAEISPPAQAPKHPKRVKSELYRQDLEVVRLP